MKNVFNFRSLLCVATILSAASASAQSMPGAGPPNSGFTGGDYIAAEYCPNGQLYETLLQRALAQNVFAENQCQGKPVIAGYDCPKAHGYIADTSWCFLCEGLPAGQCNQIFSHGS